MVYIIYVRVDVCIYIQTRLIIRMRGIWYTVFIGLNKYPANHLFTSKAYFFLNFRSRRKLTSKRYNYFVYEFARPIKHFAKPSFLHKYTNWTRIDLQLFVELNR